MLLQHGLGRHVLGALVGLGFAGRAVLGARGGRAAGPWHGGWESSGSGEPRVRGAWLWSEWESGHVYVHR